MNIFSFYNQNRKLIWLTIIAIIVVIMLLRGLNTIVVISNQRQIEEAEKRRINELEESKNYGKNQPITEERVKKDNKLLIDLFIDYCNSKKIENAYGLLSNNCKEQLFPTIDIFKKNYYEVYFLTKKSYNKEKIRNNTYRVRFYEDALANGKVDKEPIQDYYTIEEQEDSSLKLNISFYIGISNINRVYKDENIQVTVVKKQIYDEYEEYEMEIENLTYKNILLDSRQHEGTMFIEGENLKESCLTSNNISLNMLTIRAKGKKTIKIKYSKQYTLNKKVNTIVFSDVILDYDLEKSLTEQNNRTSIRINI